MTDTMDCSQARISLGAYVLGALELGERAVVDAHLAGCESCQAELADLDGLTELLSSVSTDDAVAITGGWPQELVIPPCSTDSRPTGEATGDPADRSAVRMRLRNGRSGWPLAVAAAAITLAAAGGAAFGIHAGRTDAGPFTGPALGPWQVAQGTNAADNHATVRYRPMGWGTQIAVQVTGIPLNTPCAIEAVERNGTTTVAGSWTTDSNEGKVWYPASTAVSPNSVTMFVIIVAGHPTAVVIVPV